MSQFMRNGKPGPDVRFIPVDKNCICITLFLYCTRNFFAHLAFNDRKVNVLYLYAEKVSKLLHIDWEVI